MRRRASTKALVAQVVACLAFLFVFDRAHADSPAIGAETYKQRREVLLDSLGDGTAILYSDGEEEETGHRSNSSFWYLTGINEAGAILVLSPGEEDRQVLLLAPRDPDVERWEGIRPAITDSMAEALGFDRIRRSGYLGRLIKRGMRHSLVLHYIAPLVGPSAPVPPEMELYGKVTARIPGVTIENSSRHLETMRMIKTDEEIALIQKAIDVTYEGLTDLLATVEPGATEYQLDGILEASLKSRGAQFMAFPPIIGSGVETTVLHYREKGKRVEAGELLLLDVGARWGHYCADISRTIPVDGKFTPEQAEIYDIVLEAQEAAIRAVRPGVTVREVHETAKDVIRRHGYGDAFLHGTSHHLGLDVHDVADYGMQLQPGMVITVEPGVYLQERETGVRIEDDVLVTSSGHKVLSSRIPRKRPDVEAWVAEARRKDR